MSERIHKERVKRDAETYTETEVSRGADSTELKESLDDVLDEIDSVLEENAEEFVKGYVQKGGE